MVLDAAVSHSPAVDTWVRPKILRSLLGLLNPKYKRDKKAFVEDDVYQFKGNWSFSL